MKKILFSILAALTLLTQPVFAMDRIQWVAGSNPPSPWQNQEERDSRLGLGQAIYDLTGSTVGWIHNLSIFPVTGLFVNTGPTTANTIGALYQYLPEDPTAFGGYPSGVGSLALPADGTKVMLQGQALSGTPALGPLSPPGSAGQSINYLVECQVQIVDQNQQPVSLVNGSGVVSQVNVNRDRADVITCQTKGGAAATTGTQVTPTTDSGWVAVGFVAVPNGTTTITTGMVTSYSATLSSPLVQLNPSAPQVGAPSISGPITVATQVNLTGGSTAGSSSATWTGGNNGSIISNVPTGDSHLFKVNGTTQATISSTGLALTTPLGVGQGGTGQATLPVGSCLAWNGTAIINGGCSTTGGSGVSSATTPLTFIAGVMACPTCAIISPATPQAGFLSVAAGSDAIGLRMNGRTSDGVSQVIGLSNAGSTTLGALQIYGTGQVGIVSSNAGSGFGFAATFNVDHSTTLFGNLNAQGVIDGNGATIGVPGSGHWQLGSNAGDGTLWSRAFGFIWQPQLGNINTMTLDGVGNLNTASSVGITNGPYLAVNGSTLAIIARNMTGGGYISNAANSANLIAWDNAGNLAASSFNGALPAGNITGLVGTSQGGTGTASPSLIAGSGVSISGSFPNQTVSVLNQNRALFGSGSCTYSSGRVSSNNFCDVTLSRSMNDTAYGCGVSPSIAGTGTNSVWTSLVPQSASVVRVFFYTIDTSNNTVNYGTYNPVTVNASCSEQG